MPTELARTDPGVAHLSRALACLAKARNAQEAKAIADYAKAVEVWAKRRGLAREVVSQGTELHFEAMATMGDFLERAEKNTGTAGNGRPRKGGTGPAPPKPAPTLAELGIEKRESSDAQLVSRVRRQKPALFERLKAGDRTVAQARLELSNDRKRARSKAAAAAWAGRPAGWEVVTGDVTEELRKRAVLAAEPPALVFADSPYNQGKAYEGDPTGDRVPDAEFVAWCRSWIHAAAGHLAPGGAMWTLISDRYAPHLGVALEEAGLTHRNTVIWQESYGECCQDKFGKCHRTLYYHVKGPGRPKFHRDAVLVESERQRCRDRRAAEDGKVMDDVWTDAVMPDVWTRIDRLTGTADERLPDFPTQLPLELLRRVIASTTDRGDLVLELFSGSSTAGAAAIPSGRRYVGIDRSPEYARLARERLAGVSAAAAAAA